METPVYDLAFWAAYKRWGGSRIVYVGMVGDANIPARISRVTTRNVFARINGRIEPLHPKDIRPANPNAVAAMRREGII